ncbi:hypothetical protein IG631_15872 [Alternaria alternata]|nr:hypothetical protein IG631_15872 [Alternaria alternata]
MQLYNFSQAFPILNAAILTTATLSDQGTQGAVDHPTVPSSWSGPAPSDPKPCRRVVLAPQGCLQDLTTGWRSMAIGDGDRPTSVYRIFHRLPKYGVPM